MVWGRQGGRKKTGLFIAIFLGINILAVGLLSIKEIHYIEGSLADHVADTQEQFEKEYESMLETLKGYSIEEIDTEYNKTLQQNYEAFGETIENVNTELYEK